MAREQKFRWGATGVAILFVIAALVLWVAPTRQTSSAQDGVKPLGPLISRGYTDAPAGTAVLAGDTTTGGSVLTELRVKEGQKVKRDEVIAVLSNYSKADVIVRSTEAELEKARRQREAMVSGYRTAEIAMQEVVVKSAAEETKLKALEVSRSGKPPDMKQLEVNISQQSLEREQAKLRVMKETLATDLAQIDTDINIMTAKLDNARTDRERALVRSPLDGVVIQIYTRQGERVSGSWHRQDRRHEPAARARRRRRTAYRPCRARRQGRGHFPRQHNGLSRQDFAHCAHGEAHAAHRTRWRLIDRRACRAGRN